MIVFDMKDNHYEWTNCAKKSKDAFLKRKINIEQELNSY